MLQSSFLGWGSTHSLPSSKRHASSTGRSFIFARDDSNSRSAISISEDPSDTVSSNKEHKKAEVYPICIVLFIL